MSEKLKATLLDLITWNLGIDRYNATLLEQKETEAALKWARNACSQHHTATYAPSVYEGYDRIIERFNVLGRTDLGDMLEERVKTLDKSNYTTAQVLVTLYHLMESPEKTLPWRPKINSNDDPTKELTWDDIVKDDPLPLDQDYWQDVSDDDSSHESMEDESKRSSPVEPNLDTDDSDFSLILSGLTLDDEELPQDQLVTAALPALKAEYRALYEDQFWNKPRGKEIDEATAIREAIFLLRGNASPAFAPGVQITGLSVQVTFDILKTIAKYAAEITSIRQIYNVKGTDRAPLSVFCVALENIVFRDLNLVLDQYEVDLIDYSNEDNPKNVVISILTFLEKLRVVALPWPHLIPLIKHLTEYPSETGSMQQFSNLLDELYGVINFSFSAISHDEESSCPGAYTFDRLFLIFNKTFGYYGRAMQDWIQGENTSLFVKEATSENAYFWEPKYSETHSYVPQLLNRATCQKIYEAGLSTQLLRLVSSNAYSERAAQTRPISNLFPPDLTSPEQTNTQEWWAGFRSNLNQWAEECHAAITRQLMAQLYSKSSKPSLPQFLAQYISVYFMLDIQSTTPLQFSAASQALGFSQHLFDHLETWAFGVAERWREPDKYLVQDEFEESVRRATSTRASDVFPKLLVLSKTEIGPSEDDESETSEVDEEDGGGNARRALAYLGRLRVAYPTPWIGKEVIRDHAPTYHRVWAVLQQWAWASRVAGRVHWENMAALRSLQQAQARERGSAPPRRRVSGVVSPESAAAGACKATYAAVVFLGVVQGYLHDAVLAILGHEIVATVEIKPGQAKYLSFQAVVASHDAFMQSVCDRCFLPISGGDGSRELYIGNVRHALHRILRYCAVTLIADQRERFYTNLRYFEGLVKSLRKALNLALNNVAFARPEDHQAIQRFLHRL